MPEVPPPDFINCCKAVLLNFGNLNIDEERGDLSVQIKRIASEAEVVATRIYGKGMTQREQQVCPNLSSLLSYAFHEIVWVRYKVNEIALLFFFSLDRIVHGRNRRRPYSISSNSKSRRSEEGSPPLGPIQMREMI